MSLSAYILYAYDIIYLPRVLLFYDVHNRKTEIDTWAQLSGFDNIPVILFANKADLLSNAQDALKTGAIMERSNN